MTSRVYNTPHFHIRWIGRDKLDWECFATEHEAKERATDLALPGETFTIEEVLTKCPLREEFTRNISDAEAP